MKKLLPVLVFLLSFSSLSFTQDAKVNQLLLIPEILNECDQSINSLEKNTNASNQTIGNLQKDNNSMSTIIEMQRRELSQALTNLQASEQTAQEKSKNYEASLTSLETSYKGSLIKNQEQEREIAVLKDRVNSRNKIIIGMGIGLALAIALIILIWRFRR